MDLDEQQFLEKYGNKNLNFLEFKNELEEVYNSEDQLNHLLYKSNLPWFSFPLPDIDMKEVEKECWQIFEQEENYEKSAVQGNKSYDWRLYFLYKSKSTSKRDHGRFKDLKQIKDYQFVYKNKYPALKELIEKYNHKEVPAWISANPPGGKIPLHFDTPPPARKLCKTRLAVSYPEGCAMIMEDAGIIDYYHQELVLFNQRVHHGVWNNSSKWKLDISITGHPNTKETHNNMNNSIKKKIERLLANE